MRVVKVTNPKTGTKVEFTFDNPKQGYEVSILQDQNDGKGLQYAGSYSTAVFEAGLQKMKDAGWTVTEEER